MRNIQQEVNICLQQFQELGLVPCGRISVTLNHKAKNWWYKYSADNQNHFSIQINARIMSSNVPLTSMRSVICGALIHSLPNCFRFSKTWESVAQKLNRRHGYVISRHIDIPELTQKDFMERYRVPEKVPKERQLDLQPGDFIRHSLYGQGIVGDVQKIGDDTLLTVYFQSAEPVQLMQKAAALTIQKIDPEITSGKREGGPNGSERTG